MLDDAISLGAAFCTSSSSYKPPRPASSATFAQDLAATDDVSLATEDLCRRVTQRYDAVRTLIFEEGDASDPDL